VGSFDFDPINRMMVENNWDGIAELLFDNMVISSAVGVVFLIAIEYFKRHSSNEFFRTYFFESKFAGGWFILSMAILALSIASSAYGTKKGTNTLAPSVELLKQDSTLKSVKIEIQDLTATNKELSKNKNSQGEIYFPTQKSIATNDDALLFLRQRRIELEKGLEGKNKILSTSYNKEVDSIGWSLAFLNLAFELLFELSMFYIWYFKRRCLVEMSGNIEADKEPKKDNYRQPKRDNITDKGQGTEGQGKTPANTDVSAYLSAKKTAPKRDNITDKKGQHLRDKKTTDLFRLKGEKESNQDYFFYLSSKKKIITSNLGKYKRRLAAGEGSQETQLKGIFRYKEGLKQLNLILQKEKV
jgi:hypothetical protein